MTGPVFHLQPMERLANLMIEYMVALKFAHMVRDCRISNISMPCWGIHHPPIESPGPTAVEQREQHIDLPALADQAWSGQIRRVEWTGFGQRMENFLPSERYQKIFVSPFETPMGFGPDYLVCPIRAEDILHAPHPDYVLTPVEFYRDIVEQTGLTPICINLRYRWRRTSPRACHTSVMAPRARVGIPAGLPMEIPFAVSASVWSSEAGHGHKAAPRWTSGPGVKSHGWYRR